MFQTVMARFMRNRIPLLGLFLLGALTLVVLTGPTESHAVAKVPQETKVQKDDCCPPINRFITLKIPLQRQPNDEGTYFKRHDFVRELNSKTGTNLDLDSIPNKLIEITFASKAALAFLGQTEFLKFDINEKQITLGLRDPEHPETRTRLAKLYEIAGVERTKSRIIQTLPFDGRQKTLLLIHGLESNSQAMKPLGKALESCGYQVLYFEYGNDRALAQTGYELSQTLKILKTKYPLLRLSIIAHSMGGLVSRHCLESPGLNPENIKDLFLLGTPNKGSDIAIGQPLAELVFETIPNLARGKALSQFSDGFGEAKSDLLPNSRFLKCLNSRPLAKGVNYFVIAGNRGVFDEESHSQLLSEIQRLLETQNFNPITKARIVSFLASSKDELLDGQGDGAVSLASALGIRPTASKTVARNHVQLLEINDANDEIVSWINDQLEGQ
jgi:pimeloyl-ACP methyl ester carboxylesterase